jgi:hypothetical protein
VNLDSFLTPRHYVEYDGFNHSCIHCDEKIITEEYTVIFPDDDEGRPLDACYAHNDCVENNKTYY